MALTIERFPTGFQDAGNGQDTFFMPAGNEMAYIISSTLASIEINFKYVLELYDSTGTILLARLSKYPETGGKGVFVINNILKDYLHYDISPEQGQHHNVNSYKGYMPKFYEQYGTIPLKDPLSEVTDTVRYGWNACQRHMNFLQFDASLWLVTSAGPGSFLTRVDNFRVRPEEHAWLYYLTNETEFGSEAAATVAVEVTYSDGSTQTLSIANAAKSYPCARISAGPAYLSLQQPGLLDDAVSYTVALEDSSGQTSCTPKTFIMNSAENRFTPYRLHYLNRLGGFDAYTFTMKNRESTRIWRRSYRKDHAAFNGTYYGYDAQSRGRVQLYTHEQPELLLCSDWLTDDEAEQLSELMASPAIYLEQNGLLIPVILGKRRYHIMKRATDSLSSLELKVYYAYTNNKQIL